MYKKKNFPYRCKQLKYISREEISRPSHLSLHKSRTSIIAHRIPTCSSLHHETALLPIGRRTPTVRYASIAHPRTPTAKSCRSSSLLLLLHTSMELLPVLCWRVSAWHSIHAIAGVAVAHLLHWSEVAHWCGRPRSCAQSILCHYFAIDLTLQLFLGTLNNFLFSEMRILLRHLLLEHV